MKALLHAGRGVALQEVSGRELNEKLRQALAMERDCTLAHDADGTFLDTGDRIRRFATQLASIGFA